MATENKDASKDAPKTEAKPSGSPVTAATPGASKNSDVQDDATIGNQSKTPVGGVSVAKTDPDLGKTVVGEHTTNPKADNQPNEDLTKTQTAEVVEEEKPDPAAPLTREEEAQLENILDGTDERDERDPATTVPRNESIRKLFNILKGVPKDTPDEHVVWGAAGVQLTLGDLRNLAREI